MFRLLSLEGEWEREREQSGQAKLQRQIVLIPTSPLALLAVLRASMTDYRAPLHRLLSQSNLLRCFTSRQTAIDTIWRFYCCSIIEKNLPKHLINTEDLGFLFLAAPPRWVGWAHYKFKSPQREKIRVKNNNERRASELTRFSIPFN